MENRTGERIRKRRKKLKLTITKLAERLGRDRMYVWRIEKGVQELKMGDLPEWARALETSAKSLVA